MKAINLERKSSLLHPTLFLSLLLNDYHLSWLGCFMMTSFSVSFVLEGMCFSDTIVDRLSPQVSFTTTHTQNLNETFPIKTL